MAISVVSTTAANSTSVTIPATTAGNCLVVCVMANNAAATATVSGITLGGSADNFAQAVTPGHGTNGITASSDALIWVDPNCAGGQTAIVISGTNLSVASGSGGVVVYEVSGLLTSSVVDKTSSGGAGTGTAWSSGATATTTQANEFWAGCGATSSPTGPSSPWSNTTAGTRAIAGQQIASSTGTATYSGTQSNTSWAAAVVTLKGAASSGPSGTAQPRAALPAPRRRPARAWVWFRPVTTTNAAPVPPVTGTIQPRAALPAPRRRPARAWLRFTPVTTTNAAPAVPVRGTIQPRPTAPVPRRRRERARIRFTPVATTNAAPVPRKLLISLASQAGTDDYGNAFPQGILATAGVIEGPTLIGSDAFFYSPSPGFGNLTQSIAVADGTDAFGNAYIAGTTTYSNGGGFSSAVVVFGGVVTWYKATGPGGPWTAEAGIGFSFNALTGGGLILTAPAGIGGSFAIPQPAPPATAADIISALFAAGIFN